MSNNKYKILLVEDEENISGFITALLEGDGYQVFLARTYAEGVMMYSSYVPNLVVLDLGLPDKDGSNLLIKIREKDLTPIIVLSARTDEEEKVKLLDLGANDYVTKPFGSSELLARVRSVLRNHVRVGYTTPQERDFFKMGGLEIRFESRRVFTDGREISLTQTEYNILSYLTENVGKVITYSAIIKSVWHEFPDESAVKRLQVNMANIRKKFGKRPGEESYITNILGVGYRLDEIK